MPNFSEAFASCSSQLVDIRLVVNCIYNIPFCFFMVEKEDKTAQKLIPLVVSFGFIYKWFTIIVTFLSLVLKSRHVNKDHNLTNIEFIGVFQLIKFRLSLARLVVWCTVTWLCRVIHICSLAPIICDRRAVVLSRILRACRVLITAVIFELRDFVHTSFRIFVRFLIFILFGNCCRLDAFVCAILASFSDCICNKNNGKTSHAKSRPSIVR